MKNNIKYLYLQEVYRFRDSSKTHYPTKDFYDKTPPDKFVKPKPLFITAKSNVIILKKLSKNLLGVSLTGLLGKLTFVKRFLSAEKVNFNPATYPGEFHLPYFKQNHLIFNIFCGELQFPINSSSMLDHFFIVSRDEIASFYGEILSRYDWLNAGFFHEFIIRGIGYRYRYHRINGINSLFFKIGYGHKVLFSLSAMSSISFRNNRRYDFVLSGMNKGILKQFAEQIRTIKPIDAYKGKGIKYYNTPLKLKVGKVR